MWSGLLHLVLYGCQDISFISPPDYEIINCPRYSQSHKYNKYRKVHSKKHNKKKPVAKLNHKMRYRNKKEKQEAMELNSENTNSEFCCYLSNGMHSSYCKYKSNEPHWTDKWNKLPSESIYDHLSSTHDMSLSDLVLSYNQCKLESHLMETESNNILKLF